MSKIKNKRSLLSLVKTTKSKGLSIVLTSGSWDMLHVGHMRYLKKAKEYGDILIVGVDSDQKIKLRKGKNRPIVHEKERVEMLAHLECVDFIIIKSHREKSNELIRLVSPDVLVVSESTGHSRQKYEDIKTFCKDLIVLEPQAETSTTAKIRKLHLNGKKELIENMLKEMPAFIKKFFN